MTKVRIYRMTIASFWYDKEAEHVREYEMHYKVAREGDIRKIREHLAKRGVRHFQQNIYRKFKRWIPKREIRVSFEREQKTIREKSDDLIQIESRRMEIRGKKWKAFGFPSRVLTYVKKKRKFKRKRRSQ
ncbi:hypothetical protein JW988_02265 [Candidatus Bathyarchaeota archaeon]|nr:hypothetical protein [Candidatus Bathyarchaeota archaeon]